MNMKTLSASWLGQGIVLLAMAGLLSACGGGGHHGAAPVVNANPTGYYDITGKASVMDDATDKISVPINDLQGMVYNNHLYMLSMAAGLSYEGPMTVSGTGYSANVTIYSKGVMVKTASVVGTITAGTSITGTLAGTGSGNGIFTLNYAANNAEQSTLVIAGHGVTAWSGKFNGGVTNTDIPIDGTTGSMTISTSGLNKGIFSSCTLAGTISPIIGMHLYTINITSTGCFLDPAAEGTYTGLASTRMLTLKDDTLVVMLFNATYGIAGEAQ